MTEKRRRKRERARRNPAKVRAHKQRKGRKRPMRRWGKSND